MHRANPVSLPPGYLSRFGTAIARGAPAVLLVPCVAAARDALSRLAQDMAAPAVVVAAADHLPGLGELDPRFGRRSPAQLLAGLQRGGTLPEARYIVFPEIYPTSSLTGIAIRHGDRGYIFSALPLLLCLKLRCPVSRLGVHGDGLGWCALEAGASPEELAQWIYRGQLATLEFLAARQPGPDPRAGRTREATVQRDLVRVIRLEACINLLRSGCGGVEPFDTDRVRSEKQRLARLGSAPEGVR